MSYVLFMDAKIVSSLEIKVFVMDVVKVNL